jgi:hypothetical protein
MPGRADHLRQARANLAHAEGLLRGSPSDPTAAQWAVTAAFYCAVHCIEAHLAAHHLHSRTHRDRARHMADPRVGIPRAVYTAYRRLKERSEGARYLLWQFDAATVEQEILGQYLASVTRFVKL